MSRKKKDGSVAQITAPPVVKDYNSNMGAIDKNDQLKKSCAIDRKSRRWWIRIFLHLLDICRVNSFIMYQLSYIRWNSGPMADEPPSLLNQKEFSSSLVKSLCGTFSNRKAQGRPSSVQLLLVRTPGHESVNVTKEGALKRGRCHECSIGPNKKKSRVETVYGCLQCQVRLCRDKCHDIFHGHIAMANP